MSARIGLALLLLLLLGPGPAHAQTPPTGFSRFTGTADWSQGSGVASAPASYGWMRWNTAYGANQQVAAPVTALPADGSSLCVGFHMVDPATRWSACVRRVAGTANDTVDLTEVVANVATVKAGPVALGFDATAGDYLGVNVAAGRVLYKTAAWGEWRIVATFTPPTPPATSYLGVAAASPVTITEFLGQGNAITQDTTPPSPDPVTGVTVTAGPTPSTQLVVDSTACTDLVGVVAYLTYRGLASDCADCVLVATTDGPSYTDSALTPATTYFYRRKCTDGANPSTTFSAIVSGTTAASGDGTPPTVPGSVTATLGAAEVEETQVVPTVVLTWAPSSDSGGSGLKEYIVLAGAAPDCADCLELCRTTALTVTHSRREDALCNALALPYGATLYYQVKSEDVAGNVSAGSPATGATTPPAAQYTNVSGRAR